MKDSGQIRNKIFDLFIKLWTGEVLSVLKKNQLFVALIVGLAMLYTVNSTHASKQKRQIVRATKISDSLNVELTELQTKTSTKYNIKNIKENLKLYDSNLDNSDIIPKKIKYCE
ncbi:MAG: hypothetical protein LBV69_04965 [Bacteroidales bacterium]|jgi:hypothetical protein|nr:hypothetical protein [Bacteroidales bacterium]